MPGIFGAIRNGPGNEPQRLLALVREMARRLTLQLDHRIEVRADADAVLGRYGAPFHHGTAFSRHPSDAVIAGLIDSDRSGPIAAEGLNLEGLRHPFALACRRRGTWTLAVDRIATIPVYYAQVDGVLLFASEVKALLAHSALGREIDEQALAMFLACGHLIADQTLFRSVRRLRGGHALTVDHAGSVAIERYWRFRPGLRAGELGPAELERRLGDGLAEATARMLGDPDRTALLLSGGIDSRSLLCAALEALPASRLRAVTFVGEGGDNSDVECAAAVARAAGIRHHIVQRRIGEFRAEFQEMNEAIDGLSTVAIYTPNSYGQYRLLARDGLDTVLRGDEATSYGAPAASLSEALKLVSLRSVEQVGGLAQLLHPDRREAVVAASREAISAVRAEAEGLSPAQARDTIGFEHHLQTFLASSAAYKSVFLAHRAPLLDYGLLELMEFVSDEERSDKRLFLRTMSRRYPKLFAMDFAKRWSTLEDWAAMLSGPTSARSYLLGQLQDSSSGFWELMDRAAVQELMIRIEADASGSSGPARRGLRRLALRLRGAASRHLGRRLRASLSAQQAYRPRPHVLMLRLIALKDWHDRLRVAPLAIGWESPAHPPGGEPASFELATS
ncbi:MAG TPA: asparagine synthase-related protein [Alphaproteobacteria bacterium]